MNQLFRISLCLTLFYLIGIESRVLNEISNSQPLKTWIFLKHRNLYDGSIECVGPLCDEVENEVVKCTGIDSDTGYKCNSPDLIDNDDYEANYRIDCLNKDTFDNERCSVYVNLNRKSYNSTSTSDQKEMSLVALTIYLTLGQLLVASIFIPLGYCLSRFLSKKR